MSQERYEHYADFICENYYSDKSQDLKDGIKLDLLAYFKDGGQEKIFKKLPKLKKRWSSYYGPEDLAKELKPEADIDIKKRVSFLIIAFEPDDFLKVFLGIKYDMDNDLYEDFKKLSKEWDIPVRYFMALYLNAAGYNSSAKFLKNIWAINAGIYTQIL